MASSTTSSTFSTSSPLSKKSISPPNDTKVSLNVFSSSFPSAPSSSSTSSSSLFVPSLPFSGPFASRTLDFVPPPPSLPYSLSPLPYSPPASIRTLQDVAYALDSIFELEKRRGRCVGYSVGMSQPRDSFERLQEQVNHVLSQYSKDAERNIVDWGRFVEFSRHHYLRHYVGGNEDFEMMIICWAPGQVSRIHNHQKSHCFLTVLQGDLQETRYCGKEGGKEGGDAGKAGGEPLMEGAATEEGGLSSTAVPPPSLPRVLSFGGPCPELEVVGRASMTVGDLAYINDRQALHSLGLPAALYDQRFGPAAAADDVIHDDAVHDAAANKKELSQTSEKAIDHVTKNDARELSITLSPPHHEDAIPSPRSRNSRSGSVSLHVYAPPITRVTLYEPDEGRVILRQPGFFSKLGKKV